MSNEFQKKDIASTDRPNCFVIMPISDPDAYVKGHFKRVFEDIITPACEIAGFKALRADQVKQSNLIHLDILQKLLEAPMAVCDLSSRNPNVLFELALRQSFDKPVALVQEVGTPQVFDISPFRFTEYHKERIYHEVLEDQKAIGTAIKETFDAHREGKGINSIVKLLALSKPASIPQINAPEASADIQQLILAELSQLRDEVRNRVRPRHVVVKSDTSRDDLFYEIMKLNKFIDNVQSEMMQCKDNTDIVRIKVLLEDAKNKLTDLMNSGQYPIIEKEEIKSLDLKLKLLDKELEGLIWHKKDKAM